MQKGSAERSNRQKSVVWDVVLNGLLAFATLIVFLNGAIESLFTVPYTIFFSILFVAWVVSSLYVEKKQEFWHFLLSHTMSLGLFLGILILFFGLISIILYAVYYEGFVDYNAFNYLTYLSLLSLSLSVLIYLKVHKKMYASMADALEAVNIPKILGFDLARLSFKNLSVGFIIFAMIICLELILTLLSSITNVQVSTNVQNTFAGAPILFLIFSSIIEPINEELMFRGFLVPRLGILPSAMLFGILHYSYGSTFGIEVLGAFAFGLISGFVYKRTGSLYPGILAHILINSLAALSILSG